MRIKCIFMSTLTNRDPRFARHLSHVRDATRTFAASNYSRINLWSKLFSLLPSLLRSIHTHLIVLAFHGLLVLRFLPGRCPLCVPEIQGWSFAFIALLPAAQSFYYFVIRRDSLMSSSDRNQHRSRHGRFAVRLDLVYPSASLPCWSAIHLLKQKNETPCINVIILSRTFYVYLSTGSCFTP